MPTRNPRSFEDDLESLEELERATLRLIAESMYLQLDEISAEFSKAGGTFADGVVSLSQDPTGGASITDRYDYLGEDLTRLALDTVGVSRVPGARLFGAIDYKAPRYVFLPDFAVEQALLVDSKAEKGSASSARLQITQTSMEVRQMIRGEPFRMQGLVDKVWESPPHTYITNTALVKYCYRTDPAPALDQIIVAAIPHGFLQEHYNPDERDGIWLVGPSAPTRDEKFRTRLGFSLLEKKSPWRVQRMYPGKAWSFKEN